MTAPHPFIACVGEAMVELNIAHRAQQIGFAGDTLNTAIYLARNLRTATPVGFVSVVGQDPLSQAMQAFIAAEGVGTDALRQHPDRLPGIYSIATDAAGERRFDYWRDQSAARCLFEDGFDQLSGATMIYLSGITLAILPQARRLALLDHLAAHPAQIAFDSNYRPRLWEDRATAQAMIEAAWRITDIALPSLDDEMALFGDQDEAATLARLRGYGLRQGALKRGALGPAPLDPAIEPPALPAASKVVDTTAAGDSFNGAYLAAVLQGETATSALRRAHDMAIKVIAHPGAILPRAETTAS
ncbi:sugar kinase [Phaeobacter sp. HF9A]|uniref:sugar kinase n=1 Tax=Phaeobacter sp. HF9A TaxID=2721561 RepID=UPI00142F6321|nr:sugar kinase [Phaeobacter sp. HF9A]NIZ12316.1 sugar kinase [Phaeobacter sp. HF9A]